MTGFIRVRSADGPKHEYDVSPELVAAFPDDYVVIDDEVVEQARPATYDIGDSSEEEVTDEPEEGDEAAEAAPEPSVGETNEEGA
jgi:hypothetical protein